MDNVLQLIELGIPIGIGIYIGYQILDFLLKITAYCISKLIIKLPGDDE